MKISELLKNAETKFKNAKIETARLDAMLLLQKVLNQPQSYLLAHSDDEIPQELQKQFAEFVTRREKREPVAHILGSKEFYGREFKISDQVLQPRPETELIIEAALKLYDNGQKINILDLGTGSGCIITTLLCELPNASGIGVDISKTALAIARDNAYTHKVENVEFVCSDWCKELNTQHKFHLIVSNPPYVPKREQKSLEAELNFEPATALYGGDDGLECYRLIAKEISQLDFDFAIFEIGINQENEIRKIFEQYQITLKDILPDLAGINRVMVFKK